MISVLFRADASPTLGIGHVMRCLTLADALAVAGAHCAFACTAETVASVAALRASGHALLPADARPAVDWAVIDHYRLDEGYEREARAWARRILVIDDLADRRHDCDLLLDQTPGAGAERYGGLVPVGARVLAGAHHALLRPAFAAARAARTEATPRLLIALGGTDPPNATGLVLDAVRASGFPHPVTVVLGAAAPHLAAVRAKLPPGAELRVDVADMAGLMARCTLAVGAAGSSAQERCCLGLPTVLVVIAGNQRLVAEGLDRAGAALAVGLKGGEIAAALTRLSTDPALRVVMAERARQLCDGGGAGRLAELMAALASPVPAVRPALPEDGQDLLDWRNDPATCANSLTGTGVEVAGHFAWLNRVLAAPDHLLLIGEAQGRKIGMVRFDRLWSAEWRVSITVAPEARGRGLGKTMMAAAMARLAAQFGPQPLLAEVRQENHPSRRLFEANGFANGPAEDGVLRYRHPAGA